MAPKTQHQINRTNSFYGLEDYLRAIEPDDKTDEDGESTNIIDLPLFGSKAFIGMEQYQERMECVMQLNAHVISEHRFIHGGSTMPTNTSNSLKRKHDADTTFSTKPKIVKREHQPLAKSKIRKNENIQQLPLMSSKSCVGLDEFSKNTKADNSSKKKKRISNSDKTKMILEKSRKKKKEMPLEQLMKMEDAVRNWNTYFGTEYTLF